MIKKNQVDSFNKNFIVDQLHKSNSLIKYKIINDEPKIETKK
jgi:hypothetical protein